MNKIISYKDYKNSIKNIFSFLKLNNNQQDLFIKSIKIEKTSDYFLLPVCNLHLNDKNIIEKICEWRNKFHYTFDPPIKTNITNTKKWLKNNVLKKEDKILFLVMDNNNMPIGHIGFANCFNKNLTFEIDNVLRGEKVKNKLLFSLVLKTLIKWANTTFFIDKIKLKVLKKNHRAIKFYKKNNFKSLKNESGLKFEKFVYMNFQDNEKVKNFILTAGPSISQKEIFYVNDAVKNGWNTKSSLYIDKLEKSFSNFLGAKYAISTSSCTGAMQIALMALGITKGDEVIVPNITWVATAKAVTYVNATPVFADININDWTINSKSIEKLITKKTKAIMPVHLYGQPANMSQIMKIAKKYKLHVIEDAAPAIGAEFKGKKCGTFGDFGAFSFQGAKLLVSGEGGMLVTNNYKLFKKALKISNHGRNEKKKFLIDSDGVKYKMSNVQAALALGQLERINELIALKRRVFIWYKNRLKNKIDINLNEETKDTKSIYWMTSIYMNKKNKYNRNYLIKKLHDFKIDTRPVFPELSSFKIWEKNNRIKKKFINSYLIGNRSLNLPSGVCLTKSEVNYVCDKIISILK